MSDIALPRLHSKVDVSLVSHVPILDSPSKTLAIDFKTQLERDTAWLSHLEVAVTSQTLAYLHPTGDYRDDPHKQ